MQFCIENPRFLRIYISLLTINKWWFSFLGWICEFFPFGLCVFVFTVFFFCICFVGLLIDNFPWSSLELFHRFCFVEFVSFCYSLGFCDCNKTFVQIHADTTKVKAVVTQLNMAAEFSTWDFPPLLPTNPVRCWCCTLTETFTIYI